jgi:hypothetical protein
MGLGVARGAPYWLIQNCPTAPSAASCSRMYVRTCSSSIRRPDLGRIDLWAGIDLSLYASRQKR